MIFIGLAIPVRAGPWSSLLKGSIITSGIESTKKNTFHRKGRLQSRQWRHFHGNAREHADERRSFSAVCRRLGGIGALQCRIGAVLKKARLDLSKNPDNGFRKCMTADKIQLKREIVISKEQEAADGLG